MLNSPYTENVEMFQELERHIDILKKNHRHELGIENARLREMKRQLDELTESNNKLSTQLKVRRG